MFVNDLKNFIDTGSKQLKGDYNYVPGTHFYNSKTKLWMFVLENGDFKTAFKFTEEQFRLLIEKGSIR